jgi:hypothetical protein
MATLPFKSVKGYPVEEVYPGPGFCPEREGFLKINIPRGAEFYFFMKVTGF